MVALAGDAYITRSLQLYGEYGHDEADLFRQIVRPGWRSSRRGRTSAPIR